MTAPKTTAKEPKVANDKAKTAEALQKQIDEAMALIAAAKDELADIHNKKFEELRISIEKQVEDAGFKMLDFIDVWFPHGSNAVVAAPAKAAKGPKVVKEKASLDSAGKLPELNATYKLPVAVGKLPAGYEWTKKGGRAKDEFVAYIKDHVATWTSIKV